MNPRDPNVTKVELVVDALGSLNDRMVYLGGCAVGLLITDQGRPAVRATLDVDLIVEVATHADYYTLAQELRFAGFAEASDATVLCRWKVRNLQVDIIPTDPRILGFSNRWLQHAVDTANTVVLPSKREIRLISAPMLVATKLEAFFDRGEGDFRASHDIEDIVTLVDGRRELVDEVFACAGEVREYLREELDDLLTNPYFVDALPGHLGPSAAEQERVGPLIERFRRIAGA